MNSLGLDAHSASFTLAVVNESGKVTRCLRRETSAQNLIDAVTAVVGHNRLVVEEGPLAQWIKGVVEPYVDELIVCDPRRNLWIAADDYADDQTSAMKLAQLLRGGYIKAIPHPDDQGAELRRAFFHYYDLNHQICRFKNKLKGTFRQVAVKTPGMSVYKVGQHEVWLSHLSDYPSLRRQAKCLFVIVDTLEEMKVDVRRQMVKGARRSDPTGYEILLSLPGAGPVIATGYLALIQTPARFSRKNKLWRYAGYGNANHSSDDVVDQDRPSKSGNRALKWVTPQHFQGAVVRRKVRGGKPNIFVRRYNALLSRGVGRKVARRHVCRSLLSVVRAIWLKGEPYKELPLKGANN